MNKLSGFAKCVATALMAVGLVAGATLPASAATTSGTSHSSRFISDTGWD